MLKELSVGEVAARSGVPVSTLHFYESKGLIRSRRSAGNQRRYDRDALRRVAFIRAAQRVGLSLDEIKQALDSLPEGRTPTAADWESLAGGWQAQIAERIRLLERLRDDLGSCIGCGCLSLENCALYNPDDAAYLLGHGAQYLKGRTPADAGVTL